MGAPAGVGGRCSADGDPRGARPSRALPGAARRPGAVGSVGDGRGVYPGPARRSSRAASIPWSVSTTRPRGPGGGQRAIQRCDPPAGAGHGRRARYVREARPGLDWARNRAIAEAAGEMIAFTDDDVEVDPGWIRALVAAFAARSRRVAAVTGLVVPAELDTEAQVLFERYRGFGRGFAAGAIAAGRRAGDGRAATARRATTAPARTWPSDASCSTASGTSTRRSMSAPRPAAEATWRCSSGC